MSQRGSSASGGWLTIGKWNCLEGLGDHNLYNTRKDLHSESWQEQYGRGGLPGLSHSITCLEKSSNISNSSLGIKQSHKSSTSFVRRKSELQNWSPQALLPKRKKLASCKPDLLHGFMVSHVGPALKTNILAEPQDQHTSPPTPTVILWLTIRKIKIWFSSCFLAQSF